MGNIGKFNKISYKIKKDVASTSFEAGEEGIEPPFTVLETAALPLYYSPMLFNELYYSIGAGRKASINFKFS